MKIIKAKLGIRAKGRRISRNILSRTDASRRTSSFIYDADGQLTAAADPLGNSTSFAYDKNGNRNSVTDPLQNVTTYTYDYRGRSTQKVDALKKITSFSYVDTGCPSCGGGGEKLMSLTDAVGSVTSFGYDQRGLLTSVTDPLQKITSLLYDVNGSPISKTDRNGTPLTYAYTPTAMLQSITYPDSSQMTNTYDSLDRLTQLNDSIGTSSFSYDADGRITGFTDADGFALSYLYDAAGNLTQITYPDTSKVTYAYDAANRLISVTDWLGGQATYTYDQDGRLETLTQFNGITTTYTYDIASRLTGIGSAVASYQFTLDGDGNRINSTQSQPSSPTASNGVSAVYTYNSKNDRLLSAGPLSYTYDSEGQLITSGGTCLTFDYNHRLVEVGSDTQFSYDGRGHRLIATRAGVITRYIYDPRGNLVADVDSNGVTHKYIYGKGLLAVATSSGRYCYHFDVTGNTVALTDMTQAIVNSYAYEPFGQILSQQETVAQPFKYVGQYGVMAEPNGLYYMRARYYDPSVGRFISEDPIGFAGGDVNLFAYARNNPVKWVDPLGLYIGQYPPAPPGYDPNTWSSGQWDNGNWFVKSPDDSYYTAHTEDPGHWRHWDVQKPGGKGGGQCPPNSGKPWPTQGDKLKDNQSLTDPNGDAPDWSPPVMPFMLMPINPMMTPVPIFEGVPILEPMLIF